MDESEEEYTYSDADDDVDEEAEVEPRKSGGAAPPSAMDATGNGSADRPRKRSISTSHAAIPGSSLLHEGSDDVTILSEGDLKVLMHSVVAEISQVMNIPEDAATALLRFFSWNVEKLYDQFYANPESITAKVGITNADLGVSHAAAPVRTASGGGGSGKAAGAALLCRICCENVPDAEALPCGHFFCEECWRGYLCNAIQQGPACVYTTCPEHKCPQIVPEDVFRAHVTPEELARYQEYSLRSFVDINKRLRFCPGPGCACIAQAPRSCPRVKCTCGECFCFKCGDEAHEPVGCESLALWREKCSNESETANWILANTKMCPKCNTRIEKNQGCNHMTCRQCKYEFCWICMGAWTDHGTNTGGFYKCNRYASEATEGMSDVARAKAELERYLHYYKRYQGRRGGGSII
eukprot:TRINITY_DN10622_c0_g1_i3.p1 TRINITY_DN10622_c0_g1~~TRINITY_DN10622_c0_g1_i3.p1  ORF type:complete len:409 (-),score=143.46 TRINITY_DN10622_c0_g1_i3:34-1260(-)